jgi:branched-chain amino acid transport system ATP-binding protein
MSLLAVDDIHTYYGGSYVLQGLSLRVEDGQVVCLVGRNGVGKTTTVRSVVGFTPAPTGSITFLGQQIAGKPTYEIAKRGIALVPQGRRIFPSLTVKEQLEIGLLPGAWTLDRVYKLFPRLEERASQGAKTLSGGEQSMLAIGRALMTNARLIIMDEPTEGLAPIMVEQVVSTIQHLRQEKQAILLVEQDLNLALDVADRMIVMNKGRVVFEGTPDELRCRDDVQSRYLGI